jgi:hypothetical protein
VKSEYEKKKLLEEIGVLTRMREKSELRVDSEVRFPPLPLPHHLLSLDTKVSTLREVTKGSNGRNPTLDSEVSPIRG